MPSREEEILNWLDRLVQESENQSYVLILLSTSAASVLGQDFDGNDTVKARVFALVHFAHTTRANRREYIEVPEFVAC
ncbi:MAG: hypothetical protein LUO93_08610, partial [Methanomicrobiales archaeon]|nr:hypothetical protein [Methanomicrobiales archaeon]